MGLFDFLRRAADADGDGRLETGDLATNVRNIANMAGIAQPLRGILDRNTDGKVTGADAVAGVVQAAQMTGVPGSIRGRLDVDGNGKVEFADAVAGVGKLGGAAFRALDRDGDGRLTVKDVQMMYADVLDDRVRKAGSLWPMLWKQPVLWIGVVAVIVNAVTAYLYYSKQFPGMGGMMFGAVMGLVALSGLFAWHYFNGLSWRELNEKAMSLGWIVICFTIGTIGFAGMMAYEGDVARNRGTSQALITKSDQGDLAGVVARKDEIRAAGIPRSPDLVETDLAKIGASYFCQGQKEWCKLATYCPSRKSSGKCREFERLTEELAIAREWTGLDDKLRMLAEATTGDNADTTTQTDIHVNTVAKFTGRTVEETRERIGIWQGALLESFLVFVMHLATYKAHKDARLKREATLALRRAEIGSNEGSAAARLDEDEALVAQLRGTLTAMQAVLPENPVVAAAAAEPVAAIAPPVPEAIRALISDAERPVKLEQLFKWREEGLVETMGGWMSESEAYAAYRAWAEARGGHVASSDKVHARIKETRLLVPVVHAEKGEGYGGMSVRAA